ncbi:MULTISPECIES: DEAD/DEAH box helicase family protein [unclassified Geobacillus]|uniref:DEAD/DEAH box helicase family protein n=1 Tax=unclassified Geobacillus TaxID=2642459 RepID=UPI000BE364C7|nr:MULTISPECIES: DEAD/DEAH box helicase family protein [unclassified Geobacillus]PDM41005.1 DNA helicase [Parageobacillus yumthangensis]RDV23326.1 DNA helicase [Parageobacillus toebii]TXK91581.1 DNA helicase [Parageobacillus sp. SY1]PUF89540.1 DNA helicase [Geobacillus sp. LYN3]TXK86742.1 DNA helicase [Geobacillus sp. AYS3]
MSKVELIQRNLIEKIQEHIETSSTIYILTSFVMKSGVRLLKETLKKAAERGADIKICAGDYLFVTQPEALRELISIHPDIEVRLWRSRGVSFHPKAYLFENTTSGYFIVGSSNLSKSALTEGIEWNIGLDKSVDENVFAESMEEFLKLFYADETVQVNEETLKDYEKQYHDYHQRHPNLARTWAEAEEVELMLPLDKAETEINERDHDVIYDPATVTYETIRPRFAQVEALERLEATYEEGYDKAMVVMATGLGKTYLAAFFARNFQKALFIAHREEILRQAKKSFQRVMPNKTFGIYDGNVKEKEADIIFASIFTLSMKKHLEAFAKDAFDLIVIDEFHHAAARSYQRVLNYFQPKFLLGITATPDRNDNKDVYAICDGNVAYKIDFIEAVQRGWLAPFRYYGVYDDTDYSKIKWLGNRYDEAELLQVQLREEMADKILKAWEKYKKTRTLVFCSSIKQADFLSEYFRKRNYRTVSLHSQQTDIPRDQAIAMLEKGELDAIFTVDLFNEGVDIPSVDTLLFVRPTESLTVFTQQVGRGLRLYEGKDYCVIIDLIGNYRNADVKLALFDTERGEGKKKKASLIPTVPENCSIHLDVRAINLLEEMRKKRQPRREKLLFDYQQLKQELGYRPTYLQLHLYGRSEASEYKSEFKSYIGFLYWAGELSEREKEIFSKYESWLVEVERTPMTKSYKMVVLQAMLQRGSSRWHLPITPQEAAPFFHRYLTEKEYRKRIDFSDKETKRLWVYDEEKVSKLIARMPMTKWSGSSNGLLSFDNNVFSLTFSIGPEDEEILYQWTKEICEYRLHVYFERKNK